MKMGGPLDALEQFLKGAVEGTALGLLHPKVEPAVLVRAADHEMERRKLIGPDGPVVPNVFVFNLHPTDAAPFEPFRSGLECELASYLTRLVAERGWHTLGTIRVSLVEDSATAR